jgi:hypothetical protein
MSGGNDKGGGNSPRDDRTLLDPLSHDELKALREARQRMQAKRGQGGGSAIKHQFVVGTEPQVSDPATKKSGLPTFEGGNVSLDKISVPAGSEPGPSGRAPADTEQTVLDPPNPPDTGPPGGDPSSAPGGRAGQTGFGENTLLWMQPVKPPPRAVSTAPTTTDFPDSPSTRGNLLKTLGAAAVVLALLGAVVYFMIPKPKGSIELHTNPPGAELYLDGELQSEKTPVRLNLLVGAHELRLEKDGYEPHTMTVRIDDSDSRKDVDLVPVSEPGMMTVGIRVTPVAARVTVDERVHEGVRSIQLPNLDPTRPHRIRVEAEGFVKTERTIPAGQLESSYEFSLEPIPN